MQADQDTSIHISEQDCIYQDLDNLDQLSLHLCASRGDDLLAYLRCLPPGLSYEEDGIAHKKMLLGKKI